MPVEELFAAPPEVAGHPAVRTAERLGAELLAPHAAAADDPSLGVDPAHLTRLADAGLMSVTAPVELGGHGASGRVDVEVVEVLSASCGATWFVTTQHETPASLCRRLPATLPAGSAEVGPAADRYRDQLGRASLRAGIAIAHVRRQGPPAISAEPDRRGGGYRLRGRVDWCTGWGLIDVLMIVATTPADGLVFALLPAVERAGLRASAALPLAVMGGTRTVTLELDDLAVAAGDVLLTVPAPAWRRHDRYATANVRPASVGLLRGALVELERLGQRRDAPDAVRLAGELAELAAPLRARAYQLRTAPAGAHVAERVALRGQLGELAVRATHALVATRSGSAMLLSSREQRWAREAAFHLIQAQTEDVRAALLAAFGLHAVASSSRSAPG